MEPVWSEWQPLFKVGRNKSIPREAGLYRIRRVGHSHLDHIGQTGMGLRQRLGMLSGVCKDVMPYNEILRPTIPSVIHNSVLMKKHN